MAGEYGLKLRSGGMLSDSGGGIINPSRMKEERKAKAQAALKKKRDTNSLAIQT